MDAVKLYKKHSIEELQEMMNKIQQDPKNKTPEGSFYLYTPSARKKTDAISWAITYHLQDKRLVKGETLNYGAGYTGRKQNR